MENVVTVIEPEGPESWFAPLQDVAQVHFFYPSGPVSPSDVGRIIDVSDCVIITSATAITNEQLRTARRLKMIAKCGGAPSNIDVSYAAACGISVSCVPGANTTSIAESAVMQIIFMLRRYDRQTESMKQGRWRDEKLLGRDLGDSVVGIVGLGSIGSAVLRMLQPFGCRVLVYSPHAVKSKYEGMCEFYDKLEEMLPLCDAVTLHSKATGSNENLFDERMFSIMKPTSVFINTSRGALVDEDALADALRRGAISGAAVDVYKTEPPFASSPLLSCPNAFLTPHSSGWTTDALRRECDGAVRSALAYFNNEPIPGLLNSVC